MYLVKTPKLIQNIFRNFIWSIPAKDKTLYLTFDDGPIPEVTPWVLELLGHYNAKGTFFCVGDNVKKYPHIYEQVVNNGHCVGNHTNNHFDGWKSEKAAYFDNVMECSKKVESNLFRPPYGRIKPGHVNALKGQFKIIMWDVLSGDFDPKLSKESCLENVIDNSNPGSIIVFHDSLKAEKKLRYVLPKVLEHFHKLNFKFKAIPMAKKEEVKIEAKVLAY